MLHHLPRRSTVLILLLSIFILAIKKVGISAVINFVPRTGMVWKTPEYIPDADPFGPVEPPTTEPLIVVSTTLSPPGNCAVKSIFEAECDVCNISPTLV
jgi:hypothetical protein